MEIIITFLVSVASSQPKTCFYMFLNVLSFLNVSILMRRVNSYQKIVYVFQMCCIMYKHQVLSEMKDQSL